MKDRFQTGSEKPALSGEIFFLQLNGDCASALENEIRELGGKIERFLTKEVTCVVTDGKSRNEPGSSFKNKFSRASALLQKAQEKNQTATAQPGGCNVLENASNWGIRVESLDAFTQRLKSLKGNGPNPQALLQKAPTAHSQLKLLNQHHFLKFEDGDKKYKPQFKTFGQLPPLQVGSGFTGSPFEETQSNSTSSKTLSGEVGSLKRTEVSDKRPPVKPLKKRSGFCEPCDTNYVDMHEHVKSDKHRQFSQNDNNFKRLDELVEELGSADSYAKNVEESESQTTAPPSPTGSRTDGESSGRSKVDPGASSGPGKRVAKRVQESSERPQSKIGLWSEDSSECETKLVKDIDQILETLDSDNQKGSLPSRPDSNPNPIKFSILSILQPSSSSDKKGKLPTKEKESGSASPVKNETEKILTEKSHDIGNKTHHFHQMQLEDERVYESGADSCKLIDKEKFKLNGKYVNGFTVQNLLAEQDDSEIKQPRDISKSSDSSSQGRGRKLKFKNSPQKTSSSSTSEGSQSTTDETSSRNSSASDDLRPKIKSEVIETLPDKPHRKIKSVKEAKFSNDAMQDVPTDLSKKSKPSSLPEVKPANEVVSVKKKETKAPKSSETSESAKESATSEIAKQTSAEVPKSEDEKKPDTFCMQADEFETNQPENFEPSHNILDDILQCLKFGADESESKQRHDIVDDSLDDLPDFLLPNSYPSPKNVPQVKPTADRPCEFYGEGESEPTFNPLPTYLSANLFFPESPKYEDDQPIANQELSKLPFVKKEGKDGEAMKPVEHSGKKSKEDDLQIDHLQKSIDGMLKSLKCENKSSETDKDRKIPGVGSDAFESSQCLSSPKNVHVPSDSHSAAYFYHLQQSIDKVLNSLEMDFKQSDEDPKGEQPKSDPVSLKLDKNFDENCAIIPSGFSDARAGTFDDLLSNGKCEESFPKQLSSPGWTNPTTSKVEDPVDRSACLMNAYNTFDYFDPSNSAQKMAASFPNLQDESVTGQNDSCGFDSYPLIVRKAESESSSDSECSGYDEMKQIEKQLKLFEKEKSKKRDPNAAETPGRNVVAETPGPSGSAQNVSSISEKPNVRAKRKYTRRNPPVSRAKWEAVSDPTNCLRITLKMCSSKGTPKTKRTANPELSDENPRKRLRSSTASSEGFNESNKLNSSVDSPEKSDKKKDAKKRTLIHDDPLLSDLRKNKYKVNAKLPTVYSNPVSGGKPTRLLSIAKEDGPNKKQELDVYNFSDSDEPSDRPVKKGRRKAANRSPRKPRQRKM